MATAATSTASVGKRGRWRFVPVYLALVAVVAAAAWGMDAWLLARLRIIATDTFTSGHANYPQLFPDGSEELNQYPPCRLAAFLSFPSPQIRATVCLSLGERWVEPSTEGWEGVVPKLLTRMNGDGDAVVRNCAREALARVPYIPPVDEDAVVAFVEGPTPNDDDARALRTGLVIKACESNPARLSWAVAFFDRWLASKEVKDRRTAFQQLLTIAPDAPETLAAFRRLMEAGDPDGIAAGGGASMFRRQPQLVDAFIGGNEAQRMLVLKIALQEVQSQPLQRHPDGRIRSMSQVFLFSPSQMERLQSVAMTVLVENKTEGAVRTGLEFLQRAPDGAALLMNAARKARGLARSLAILRVRDALRGSTNALEETGFLDDLLRWLREDDAQVRDSVIAVLDGGGDREWLARQKTGHDAVIVEACRRTLDRFPSQQDFRCLDILFQAAPALRDDDVDRIADALCRSFERFEREHGEKNYAKKGLKYGTIHGDELQRRMTTAQTKRPAVTRFLERRRKLESKGILGPISAPPTPNVLAGRG
jgi:hypothetical protein